MKEEERERTPPPQFRRNLRLNKEKKERKKEKKKISLWFIHNEAEPAVGVTSKREIGRGERLEKGGRREEGRREGLGEDG